MVNANGNEQTTPTVESAVHDQPVAEQTEHNHESSNEPTNSIGNEHEFEDEPRRNPTPEEIAAMCAEIREGWSEREHWIRAGYAVDQYGRRPKLEVMRGRVSLGRSPLAGDG